MHPVLATFVRKLLGVVAMALVPVVLTAFVSPPLALGAHPGESPVRTAQTSADRHMS